MMGSYHKDIICRRCGHAVLLDEIVRVFLKHKDTAELQERLRPLMAKAKEDGFW